MMSYRTLIFGVGILADHRRKGEARMSKNRSRTLSRWHPVGTIVRRASGAASGKEAAILAASISSRAKRGTGVSKHVWYSWWCYFLRLSHGFGRPAHTANCNMQQKESFKSCFKSGKYITLYIRYHRHFLIRIYSYGDLIFFFKILREKKNTRNLTSDAIM